MKSDIFVVIEHLRDQVTEISFVMLAAARQLATGAGGKVVALLLGHKASGLASNLAADLVLYAEHPALADFTSDAYQKALAGVIGEQQPRAVLFGHTSIGMDVASGLSATLGLPLVGACSTLSSAGKFVSQTCGGKIMVEGDLPASTTLITLVPGGYKPEEGQSAQAPQVTPLSVPALGDLRVTLKRYIEPEIGDVDITKEALLISIGRGIQTQDNIVLAEDLAQELSGAICASRPVVDQGWLSQSRLVGKSGKTVHSKVYLAIGISGAPEHVEAITGCEAIIAINTDPAAPIFNYAKYGTTVDLFDLIPVLTDKVREAKSA